MGSKKKKYVSSDPSHSFTTQKNERLFSGSMNKRSVSHSWSIGKVKSHQESFWPSESSVKDAKTIIDNIRGRPFIEDGRRKRMRTDFESRELSHRRTYSNNEQPQYT